MAKSKTRKKRIDSFPEIKKGLRFLKEQGINYHVDPNMKAGEGWFIAPNTVAIGSKPKSKLDLRSPKTFINNILSAIYHEYAHYYQNKNKMWQAYLNTDPNEKSRTSTLRKFLRTALRCERHADRLGEDFMKEDFPKRQYINSYYVDKIVKKWKKSDLEPTQKILKARKRKKQK